MTDSNPNLDTFLTNLLKNITDNPEAELDRASPVGGLPVIPEKDRRKSKVYSENCYICRDPEFAMYGLPLCMACPYCSGHVAADDSVCDECGKDIHEFYEI